MEDSLRTHARRAHGAIRAGHLRGPALLDELLAVPFRDRDVWVDEALGLKGSPDDMVGLPAGAVPYVPCGVDAIVRTVLDAPVEKDAVFVDLGAGLGRVAILVHLLTGARAIGVELQPALVDRARATAAELALRDVAFQLGDAGATEVADGTVFFIYASFSQPVLRRVLAWLAPIASRRSIVLCAVGFDVVGAPWLTPRASSTPELVLYDPSAPAD